MDKLIKAVRAEIQNEYQRASEEFGPVNNSDWEIYGVILEELEEVAAEIRPAGYALSKFWSLVKDKKGTDEQKLESLQKLENKMTLAACECIQVAAMAYKAQKTIQQRQVN